MKDVKKEIGTNNVIKSNIKYCCVIFYFDGR